jgi:CyaY protein
MTESEFNRLADQALGRLERAIDEAGADIDYESAGGILELTFGNGSKMVINKQAAAQEIWVAARSGGYHFAWRDGAWVDTRDGTELYAAVGRLVREQGGVDVPFS